MVPFGAGSPGCATHALAVGEGVPVTNPAVGVASGVGVGFGVVGDPHAARNSATPAVAATRRNPADRSADSGRRLLVRIGHGDDIEMLTGPSIDGVDHALQIDTRRSELV